MNKKNILLGITTLALIGLMLSPKLTLAYKGDPSVKGPNYTAERHEAMTKAFNTKNYNAWKSLMTGRGKVTQLINEKNFVKFAEAHKLALEGKINEANKIRIELGLGLQNGSGKGSGMGCGRLNR